MNKIQIAQLAWAAHANKKNLDTSMVEMGKSIENLVTAMANVDAEVTVKMLEEVLVQVKEQAKTATERLIAEKGEFVDGFLKGLPEDGPKEITDAELAELQKKPTEH